LWLLHEVVCALDGYGAGRRAISERYLYWNFVSSSKDRLGQAVADWRAGRMKLPDADYQEFIPLPEGAGAALPARDR
jgi:hypothetical protein